LARNPALPNYSLSFLSSVNIYGYAVSFLVCVLSLYAFVLLENEKHHITRRQRPSNIIHACEEEASRSFYVFLLGWLDLRRVRV
jgi:hypothetical protein